MKYEPINEAEKEQWIAWLRDQVRVLTGKPEEQENKIFQTPEGDVSTGKDLVGKFLATLTGTDIEIS